MFYFKNICLTILSLFLVSCKGSNEYLITNGACNCKKYVVDSQEFRISISGIYYLIEKDMISEFTLEIFNNSEDEIFFKSLENILYSQKYDFKNITKDTLFEVLPNTGKKFSLVYDGRLRSNQNSIPRDDKQTLTINLIGNQENKFEIKKIELSTTTWDY